jgi:putative transposase
MSPRLERRYGHGDLHFVTCSCYRRQPFFGTPGNRDFFLKTLSDVRDQYGLILYGYVVMPEHFHILISEPPIGNPSIVLSSLKKTVSESLGRETNTPHFWYRRFYDFNVKTSHKKIEKLNYMHFNPVKRGLVEAPDDWAWSSSRFYSKGEIGLCPPNPDLKFV